MSWFRASLVVSLALALVFLTLPVLAIFVDQPPRELIAALGEPGALDALWLSLRTTAAALAIIVLVGTPAAYLLATRRFRGAGARDHADRAAARAPARGRRHRAAGRGRAVRDPRRRDRGRRRPAHVRDRRRGRRAHLRGLAVLHAPGAGGVRRRSIRAGSRPRARSARPRRARSRGSRSRPRAPGLLAGGALALGPRARRVRRHADVRRRARRRHADRAAGDLRALRDRLRRRAGAVGRAGRGVGWRSCCRSSSWAAGTRSAMLRVAAETQLGDVALDVALEVAAGECLALAGPSGAGKTSVLRVVAGLAAARPRARGVRRAGVARPRARGRPAARARGAAATCSRTTRCSRT